MNEIVRRIDLGYRARPQFEPFHARTQRWAVMVCHRRAGKTLASVMDVVDAALRCQLKAPRFAYVAPTYTQAKDVAWEYLKHYTAPLNASPNESELRVDIGDRRVRLYGAENYDRMRGIYLDGVILDEYADMDPRAWTEVIRPALSDRQGWAVFIGTPKGHNDLYRMWRESAADLSWYRLMLKASETALLSPDELADARKAMSREQYEQEYECSFEAAVKGAYYGKDLSQAESEGRITRVPHDKAADTFAAWDLGVGPNLGVWVYQRVQMEWHWLRYWQGERTQVGAMDQAVDWLKALPFKVQEHFVPHDSQAENRQSGRTDVQFLEARDLNVTVLKRHTPEDRIRAAQREFTKFWFDEKGCGQGLDALRMYRAEYDEKQQTLRNRPLHDWASHGADAFGYGVYADPGVRVKRALPQIDGAWVR